MVSRAMPLGNAEQSTQRRLTWSFGLVGVIWIVGLIGHFTVVKEWPALFIYVLGGIGLTVYYCWRYNAWQEVYITRTNLKTALLWGGGIGLALFFMDVFNTYQYYRGGGEPMAQMEAILVEMKLLYLFPVLIIAEEFLWRGLMFSALLDRGVNKHLVVVITTLLYMANHFAVAPVGMLERGLMAVMALPIGIAAGYLVIKTKNLWGGVTLHMLTMISMAADIFIIPNLV